MKSCAVLLSHGVSAQIQDRNGRTAAHAAADSGFADTLRVLLHSGNVDPNQRDSEGRNLVHWAATVDCVDVMHRLSRMPGIEIAKKDHHGSMPIDIAYRCQCPGVGRLLDLEMARRAEEAGTAHHSIYAWEELYNSPTITDLDDLSDGLDIARRDAVEGQALRRAAQEENHRRWRELRAAFPDEEFGLVRVEHERNDECWKGCSICNSRGLGVYTGMTSKP